VTTPPWSVPLSETEFALPAFCWKRCPMLAPKFSPCWLSLMAQAIVAVPLWGAAPPLGAGVALRFRIPGPLERSEPTKGITFSPDGPLLAIGCRDGGARVFDARSGKAIASLPNDGERLDGFAFSPDGKVLASYGSFKLSLWSLPNGKRLSLEAGMKGIVCQI